jgi:hypothetical protein
MGRATASRITPVSLAGPVRCGPLRGCALRVFIVDDNLICNKKAINVLLRDVADSQRRRATLAFLSEVSLELAGDPEWLEAMGRGSSRTFDWAGRSLSGCTALRTPGPTSGVA